MNSANDAWLDALLDGECEPSVLVTVVAARGSAPRAAGAKMVVTRDTVAGTIGGGHLELQAIAIARDLLSGAPTGALRRFPLGAALGQCCGGAVDLLFDPVLPGAAWVRDLHDLRAADRDMVVVGSAAGGGGAGKLVVAADRAAGSLGDTRLDAAAIVAARELLDSDAPATLRRVGDETESNPVMLFLDPIRVTKFDIVLFGAGHVGRALVRALTGVPCRITWVDERAQEFPSDLPAQVRPVVTDTPVAEIDAARPGSYFLVMTHSHALDQELAERILRRDDFAYFGLIGSTTKRRLFERRMATRGVPNERFARMTCPIGMRGITGKEPAVIALAVAAELVQVYESRLQRSAETDRHHARSAR